MTEEYMYEQDETTTLNDEDILLTTIDVATTPLSKFIKWSSIKTLIGTALGSLYNALTAKTSLADSDVFSIGDSASSYASKKTTWANVKSTLISDGGWNSAGETWTYSSVDSPSGVISVNADVTSKYTPGMRIKYNQTQALTAYWSFDTNSNSDVGSFNGTDTSMTYTAGKFSNAATFNGTTSKIVITDNSSLKPTGEFTLGFWVKSSNTGANKAIFQSYSQNTNTAGFFVTINTSNVIRILLAKNTGTTVNTDYSDFTGSTNVCDNVWHYVVITFRNNYLQLYVDGVLENQGYSFTPVYAATNYVRVGARNDTGTDASFMNGQIDDLFLINGYAVDENWIRAKYAASTAQGTGSLTLDKMGIITKIGAYSGGATLVTVYGGTDYTLTNATISNPYFSTMKVPYNFNASVDKWRVLYISGATGTQSSPVNGTWYNLAGSISIPIGAWQVDYSLQNNATAASSTTLQFYSTLSKANNTESNTEFTTLVAIASGTAFTFPARLYGGLIKQQSKTTWYLNSSTAVSTYTSLNVYGGIKISAKCLYL